MEIAVFLATLVAFIGIERIAALRFEPAAFRRPFFGSDLLYLLTGVVALGPWMRSTAARTVDAAGGPLLPLDTLLPGAGVVAAIVLYDLGGYASHWLLHRIPWLWRIHEVHHSSRRLDWLATFRAHGVEHALRHALSPVALLVVGFAPATVALAASVYGAFAVFSHANFGPRLRWLEPLFVTPRLHRLHHVPATSESNLGTIFSVWDRLRGSLVTDPAAALAPLGVPGALESYPQTWGRQLVAPFRRRTTASAGRGPARSLPTAG